MSEQTALSAMGWAKQESTRGYSYVAGLPRTFETTSDGNSDGTILYSTSLASYASGDDDFVGMILEVVEAQNGPGISSGAPLRRTIMAYDHEDAVPTVIGKMTVESFGFQIVAGDKFRILQDPGPLWSEDTGGSTTTVSDASRDEADDYWNGAAEMGGPYMMARSADSISAGTQRLITDFDQATGDATVATLPAATAVGDLYEAISWPEVVGGVPLSLSQPRVDRPAITGRRGQIHGVAGLREASGQLELLFRGPGAGREGEPAEIDVPLGAVCDVTADSTDETVGSGSSTTSVNVSAAVAQGSMWLTEAGDVCVASDAADPFTPVPSLRIAPADGTTLYSLRKYAPAESANYAVKLHQWLGRGVRDELVGCLPSFQLAAARGEFAKITLPFTAADWKRVYEDESASAISRPSGADPILPTVTPRAVVDVRVNLDGVEYEARSVNLDLALDIQPRVNLAAPNEIDGLDIRGDAPTGTIDLYLDDDAKAAIKRYIVGDTMPLLVQIGTQAGDPGVLAVFAPQVEITGVEIGDDSGAVTAQVQFRVTLDTTSDLERWMLGIG